MAPRLHRDIVYSLQMEAPAGLPRAVYKAVAALANDRLIQAEDESDIPVTPLQRCLRAHNACLRGRTQIGTRGLDDDLSDVFSEFDSWRAVFDDGTWPWDEIVAYFRAWIADVLQSE